MTLAPPGAGRCDALPGARHPRASERPCSSLISSPKAPCAYIVCIYIYIYIIITTVTIITIVIIIIAIIIIIIYICIIILLRPSSTYRGMQLYSLYIGLQVPIAGLPNGPFMEALWSLIVGVWGTTEGSWGV